MNGKDGSPPSFPAGVWGKIMSRICRRDRISKNGRKREKPDNSSIPSAPSPNFKSPFIDPIPSSNLPISPQHRMFPLSLPAGPLISQPCRSPARLTARQRRHDVPATQHALLSRFLRETRVRVMRCNDEIMVAWPGARNRLNGWWRRFRHSSAARTPRQ